MTSDTSHDLNFDLIRKYDVSGPRYTSCPTVPQFHENYNEKNYSNDVRDSNGDLIPKPLSLYFHLPFCAHVCYYCACDKILTANCGRADRYIDNLIREMQMHAALFDTDRQVSQIHWGGGTPTYIGKQLLKRLMAEIRLAFRVQDDENGEYSIEIDPREATPGTIEFLRNISFNRMSVGVQDFDPLVQTAINRLQTFGETRAIIKAGRDCGFHSISIDLIYGLPYQSVSSFSNTLDKVLQLNPDRLSVFNYAHLPQLFKSQRQIDAKALPGQREKLRLLELTINRLTSAGYVYIGMDHFAKPEDALAVSQRNQTLHRNFQGYSTRGDCDLIGIGVTSIGMVGDSYSQNYRSLDKYYDAVEQARLPIFRGLQLTPEDRLRREIIMSLICHFRIDYDNLERKYAFSFQEFFAKELQSFQTMQEDGLVHMDNSSLQVTPVGRFMIRNICMAFDVYYSKSRQPAFFQNHLVLRS